MHNTCWVNKLSIPTLLNYVQGIIKICLCKISVWHTHIHTHTLPIIKISLPLGMWFFWQSILSFPSSVNQKKVCIANENELNGTGLRSVMQPVKLKLWIGAEQMPLLSLSQLTGKEILDSEKADGKRRWSCQQYGMI